ncbi:hypothetical protein HPY42_02440 [Coprothermobacteraceae bacterium]|nr:hypothetical protein [Coprothermobacteraceae bacterium]
MQFRGANGVGKLMSLLLVLVLVTGLLPPAAEVQATVGDSGQLASQLPNGNIAAYSGDFTSNAVSDLRTSSAYADGDSSSAVSGGSSLSTLLAAQSLPQSVDWSNWLPPVDEQSWDDCVSWAVVYYNMTFIKAREQGWDPKLPEHIFSPSFTYHQVGGENGGNTIPEVMEFIKKVGAAPIAVFPYSRLEEDSQPMPWQVEQASPFKISSYEKVYDHQKDKFDQTTLNKLKGLLASGNLLVISVDYDSLFFGNKNKDLGYVATIDDAHMGGCGHALVVVGYDDSRFYVDSSGNKHYGAFKLINSWGTYWGANGFAYVSYDWMEHSLTEAWVMYNKPTPLGFVIGVQRSVVQLPVATGTTLIVPIIRTSGFKDRVTLSVSPLEKGLTATIEQYDPTSSTSALISVNVSDFAKPGQYSLDIVASSGSVVRRARVFLKVTHNLASMARAKCYGLPSPSIVAAETSPMGIRLQWQPLTGTTIGAWGIKGYALYRWAFDAGQAPTFGEYFWDFYEPLAVLPVSATSFLDKDVQVGGSYRYYLASIDEFGCESLPTIVSVADVVDVVSSPRSWSEVGTGFRAGVTSVSADPTNPNIVYAGTNVGVYKSEDGGRTWRSVFSHPGNNKVKVIHGTPSIVVVAVETDVLKSEDGGLTWGKYLDSQGGLIQDLYIDPNLPETMYIDTIRRIDKVVAGKTESILINPLCGTATIGVCEAFWWDLDIARGNSNLLYVSTSSGLLKSEDGGRTWSATGLKKHAQSFALDPVNPVVGYAVVREDSDDWVVYKTPDGGSSWQVVLQLGKLASSFVEVSKADPRTVYVYGCPGVYISHDEGRTWQHVQTRGKFTSLVSSITNPNVLYATEPWVELFPYIWKSEDGGLHWFSIGYAVSWPFSVIIDPQNSNRIIVGTDMGVAVSENGGLTFDKGLDNNPMATIRALAFHPKTSSTVFGGTFGLPVVSTNSGNSWSLLYSLKIPDSGLYWRNPTRAMYVSGDSSRERIYLATADGLLEVKWNKASVDPFEVTRTSLDGTYLFAVAADPRNSNRILAGGVGGVYVSSDGGISWAKSNNGLTNTLVSVLLFDPVDPAKVWLGTDGSGVFVSLDGGMSWQKSGTGLENVSVTAIAVNSREPNLVFAGTENGLFESWDGGKTWHYSGLRGAKVLSLAIDYAKDLLYVGTDKSGLVTTNIGRPLAPVDFDAVPTSTAVVLSWKPSPGGRNGVRGYEVYRSTRFDLSDAVRIASLGPESLTYVDGTARPGVTYYYYAVALDSSTSENRSSLSQVAAATILENQIHASAGTGGSIKPAGTVTVAHGGSQTFTITPNPGYRIADVIVDGKSVGAVTSYIFSSVTENHTINAVFEKAETLIVLQIGKSVFTVDGMARTLDSPPVIKNSRTLLPIRAIVEALGGQVGWDANQKKVTVTLGSKTVELWIGKNTALVNGRQVMIDATNPKVVPEIINGRTMLPLRFVAESLGCSVEWDGNTQTVRVTYQKP